jgi:acyl-CoA synthetase (AMP-forming)/AMP-acid ligase II
VLPLDLARFGHRQHLPKYKMPALINIVQELAVSESGKVERKHCG